ncbi:MAG: 50S ribosomal protein L9 [Anaerolineae bacterium]
MEVMLLTDVEDLGRAGEVREVNPGYARNYLIPQGLAQVATEATLKQAEGWRQAARVKQEREEAQLAGLADRIEGSSLRFEARVGEEDRIYGSITTADIAEALSRELGEPMDRRKIVLEQSIRELGTREVTVKLSARHEVRVSVTVVGADEDEAD